MSFTDNWSDEEFIRQMNKIINHHKEQEKDDDSDSE
ncbi:hypothetical protein CFSAN001092_08086 [Salmonella enterica subsp. enterica serovar Nchanga str. CFSAN001092]|uniref:Uncharacterized protein n=1 Tax=Salmonella enterica I TaxID=59201 RepID=A0A379V352_SALET|nr:hypothetical protein CFSAN001091_22113 [Salmonella enterica subsp. enterica serovar Nchanga str. CFSAN001091]ESJ34338.1 hypothetical protein CFSAN001092_08086 [Salmonella enterica subsp. enterica serovar Nchanga str. CFSAN001092]SUG74591.1 Uncharacterised protein [Salmonella enterica subsp. enterica]